MLVKNNYLLSNKIKKINVKKKYFNIFIIIIFILQIILIAHRSSFSPEFIFKFYKEDVGLEEGIRNKKINNILKLIKKNKLNSFRLSDKLLNYGKTKQRVFEGAYPYRYSISSNYLITTDSFEKENCKFKEKIKDINLLYCE